MNETIRCFLAIDLADDIYPALEGLLQRLRSPLFDVRWVSPRNTHLTLRFFGEISSQEVDRIIPAVEKAVRAADPFEFCLQGLGAFPSFSSPKVIWLGIDQPNQLLALETCISRELEAIGSPPPDKPFRPHLTLGRVKSFRGKKDLLALLQKHQGIHLGRMTVDHVSLIKSDLRPAGPVYTRLNPFFFTPSSPGTEVPNERKQDD